MDKNMFIGKTNRCSDIPLRQVSNTQVHVLTYITEFQDCCMNGFRVTRDTTLLMQMFFCEKSPGSDLAPRIDVTNGNRTNHYEDLMPPPLETGGYTCRFVFERVSVHS